MNGGAPARAVVGLLALAAVGSLALAVGYNELLLGWLAGKELHPETIARIRQAQLAFAAAGGALAALAWCGARVARVQAALGRPFVANALLATLFLVGPIAAAELVLRPLARSAMRERTTLFARDAELGWKLRPGARERWVGVDVEINAKGLRGPEIAWERTPGAARVVWLGDSVTFGYGLPRHDQAYPYVVARLAEGRGVPIETVNAAVDGYSPWQQAAWLEREGFRYAPDLVVVGFVLNDVTEKLTLARFGGSDEGVQLAATATWADRVFGPSALVHYVRRLGARLRFGADTRAGALAQEVLAVESLAREPDAPAVQRAWEITLDELRRLVAACRERKTPVALIAFPFTFQFEDPAALSAPQRLLARFAAEQGVPFLDLLPPLAERVAAGAATPEDLFLDVDHPSVRGSEEMAELVLAFLEREGLLARLREASRAGDAPEEARVAE